MPTVNLKLEVLVMTASGELSIESPNNIEGECSCGCGFICVNAFVLGEGNVHTGFGCRPERKRKQLGIVPKCMKTLSGYRIN